MLSGNGAFQSSAFQQNAFQCRNRAGAGKRRDFPAWLPQPAYEAKKNKPVQPIWDRLRRSRAKQEIDRQKALDRISVQLPPSSIFAPAPQQVSYPAPTFPTTQTEQVAEQSRDAQDLSDMQDMGDVITLTQAGPTAPVASSAPQFHDTDMQDIADIVSLTEGFE